jgi:hypothetical protein
MTAVFFDASHDDDARRQRLYGGDLTVQSPGPESRALCQFAQHLTAEAFGSLDPEFAQFELAVEQYARILSELKPRFIHHPETKQLVRSLLLALGCDGDSTYFDVPRLRSSTSHGYLTTGIAFAFHPHRDTWYSAPMSQINCWTPVYAARPDNVMAFHPEYWDTPLRNSSACYDYQRWTATSRYNAAQHIGSDTREQPKALEPVRMSPDLRVLTPIGGTLMFSAAQLHSSLPNQSGRTRFSIDFRIVNRDDLEAGTGARNVDSSCTGTALTDFLRVSDLTSLPVDLVQRYLPGHPQQAATALARA